MSDLVKKLHEEPSVLGLEAADEIESLRAQIERLRNQLVSAKNDAIAKCVVEASKIRVRELASSTPWDMQDAIVAKLQSLLN